MDRDGSPPEARLLERFGVPAEAETLWRGLMANPTVASEELANSAGLSARQFDSTVRMLIEARLLRNADTPTGLVATDPTLAVEAHIVRAERGLTAQLDELAQLRGQIPQLARIFALGRGVARDQPGFEIIDSLDDVVRQIHVAVEQTTKDLRSLVLSQSAAGLRQARDVDHAALARGVRLRSIVGTRDLEAPELYAQLEFSHQHGELIRAVPQVPTRLLILDRNVAVLPIDPDDINNGAMFVRVRNLIDLLIYMFDQMWAEAEPLFIEHPHSGGPSGRTARVLELLALGNTDERIGRTLGAATRTIRRDIADLKSMLGVTSRAEIAAAAVRKGWL
jgi:DNA-binding CsgD family transcriptional regulator